MATKAKVVSKSKLKAGIKKAARHEDRQRGRRAR